MQQIQNIMIKVGSALFLPFNSGTSLEIFSWIIFLISVIILIVISRKLKTLKSMLLWWFLGVIPVMVAVALIIKSTPHGGWILNFSVFEIPMAGALWFIYFPFLSAIYLTIKNLVRSDTIS